MCVKIVFASTQEQEEKIKELIHCIYQDIFPLYFSDEEIEMFQKLQILHITSSHLETLGDAYKIISSLQTITSILQLEEEMGEYQELFTKNVEILNEADVFFPFSLEQFLHGRIDNLSIYSKAANELLI